MSRDGSGNFTRVVTPPVNGDIADADDYNAEQDDVASALSDSINKAGTKAFAADQSMGGFKITSLGDASAATDAMNKQSTQALLTAGYQPLDATLTAFAAIIYTSGSLHILLTAADTFTLVSDALYPRLASANIFTLKQTVSLNSGTLPTPQTGTVLQIANADGTATFMEMQAFGTVSAGFSGRVARNTAASPSAIQAGDTLFQVFGRGYGATAYGNAAGILRLIAKENFTDSVIGSYWAILTARQGAINATEIYRAGDFTNSIEIGYRDGGPGSVPDATYTFALTDRGTPTDHTSGSAHTYTVPPQSSVAMPANAVLYGTNYGAGALTIGRGSAVVFRDAAGTDADLTVAQYQSYVARRHPTSTDVWTVRVF